MKKFISGFVLGTMIFATIGAVAVSYVATPAGFKVLVNGEEFTSDPPAMVINDRTYLPLRAMGDALGVPVEWNAEKQQAEIGVNNSVEPDVEYYSKFNTVPDFAAVTGIAKKELSYNPDTRFYEAMYIISDDSADEKENQYINILTRQGFKDVTLELLSDANTLKVYNKDKVYVAIGESVLTINIYVWQTR